MESDLVYALVDLVQGDESAWSSLVSRYNAPSIKKALDFILNNPKLTDSQKSDLLLNSWRVQYKVKPPTPQEFLTEKYLGRMSESVWPRVQSTFLEFYNDDKQYRNAVLYPHIGWGKSTLSVLINLYTTTHFALMRDPKKWLNLSAATVLASVLCSYSLKKSSELLLEPFMNILDSSDYFVKVRTREDMIALEDEYAKQDAPPDHIYWTTASIQGTSVMTFTNGINYKLVSNKNNLLGLSIINGTMTELGFFREAGKSDDYIMSFFNDLKKRINSRMKLSPTGRYWGRSILDSSPNDIESPIDRYVLFDAQKDPGNLVIQGSQWQWAPDEFNMEKTFPVYKGGNGKPPAILSSELGYSKEDIIQVPQELYQYFYDDLKKSLKDLAGIPSGSLDKLFYDNSKIDNAFNPKLKSIYTCIRADASMPPYELIWKQIRDQLFVKTMSGKYSFYYKPDLPRCIHIDQSISTDMTAIGVVHVERMKTEFSDNLDHDLMYVVDFVVPIHPFGGRINLEAVKDFVVDLAAKGRMNIAGISFDTFQSENAIQALTREGFEVENISVDKTLDPYMYLAQLIDQGKLKVGKNIFLKNNLKALRIVPRKESGTFKVDHTLGESPSPSKNMDENWDSSLLGIHAKDVSDAVCGAVYNAKKLLATSPTGLREVWDEGKIYSNPKEAREAIEAITSILKVKPAVEV